MVTQTHFAPCPPAKVMCRLLKPHSLIMLLQGKFYIQRNNHNFSQLLSW